MNEQQIEDEFLDVLQNIESVITQVDRESQDLIDAEIIDAIDALMQTYNAEVNGRTPPTLRLSPLKRRVYDRVREVCEWRLGRSAPETSETPGSAQSQLPNVEPITPQDIVACLKRIRLSAKRWTSQNGRRGYLEFIRGFLL